ncbi:hypothetical protein SAMN05216267_102974 [Actinacidiphila rubida]|uniref:Uncharacterized protein n=1 Tax=Actinacidiphila rubida TaxID=310780 RepID=A0A1H8QEW8_9ACTN|nr:hypothetical protein SAMN05216267_102974 [Actinacidiphila rubida]
MALAGEQSAALRNTATAPEPETYRPRRKPRRPVGPRRLGTRAVVALVLVGALCALAVTAAVNVRDDTARLRTTVAERAEAAAQLRFALADLDAQRADTLAPGTSGADPRVTVGNQLNALITAQQRRSQISDLLRQLGADATQGDRVRTLLDALGRYDDLSGRASYVDEQSPDRVAGHPPRIAVALNAQAGLVMHDTLLPAATQLSTAYLREADATQAQAHRAARRWALAVGLLGALTLLYLLWWQRELARDYRRLVNPAIALGTAVLVAVTMAGTLALTAGASDVDTAVASGLRPWTRLAEARAVAAQAATAESRWFVHDGDFAKNYRDEFTTLSTSLGGLLAPGARADGAERAAYQDVIDRYHHFLADDTRLRSLKDSGDIDQGATVLTEVGRGDVAFDFWDFATTLDGLAEQQLADFTAHVSDAHASLDGWPALPAGLLGAAGVLVLLGVRPRLAEYR